MTFDELTLHNFGTYAGRQTIKLRPLDRARPLIVIGGLNGRGKTTLLDAIQLVLYGKRARCSNRGSLPYEEYLRRSIHKGVPGSEGASVNLRFIVHEEGHPSTYDVRRVWTATAKNVREHIEVSRNDSYDRVMSERWDDEVESILPLSLSSLFFFDGEKIAELAEEKRGTELMSTAVSALLGLELVDRLDGDLLMIERKSKATMLPTDERVRFESLVATLRDLENQAAALVEERAAVQNDLDRLQVALASIQDRIVREGGDEAIVRQLESERLLLEKQVEALHNDAHDLAAGALPLALILPLISRAEETSRVEQRAMNNARICELLNDRDSDVLARFREIGSAKSAAILESILASDRKARIRGDVSIHLHVTESQARSLAGISGVVEAELTTASRILRDLAEAEKRLADISRTLEIKADDEHINALAKERVKIQRDLDGARARLLAVDERLASSYRNHASVSAQVATLEASVVHASKLRARTLRTIEYAGRVRETLNRYRASTLAKKLSRLETLILDSFSRLIRKPNLITRVTIDPSSLVVTLRDNSGEVMPADRLSAAERQLFAIAMLWGLARASIRPLPTIIDTPLGRLDSVLRASLIHRYFPDASHQTVLLSTDEEIDNDAANALRPFTSRTYQLVFDNDTRATSLVQGYFWERDADAT